MELNRVERRVLNLMGIEIANGDTAVDLYRRIRIRYENEDSYFIAAYNAIDKHLKISIGKHMPPEYSNAMRKLNPFIILPPKS